MQRHRSTGRVLAVLAVLAAAAALGAPSASPGVAAAAAGPGVTPSATSVPCSATAAPSLRCYQVAVPLDRSGVVAGTVSLHVEVSITPGVQRGVMFLLAGGPGQGSAHTFDLGSTNETAFYHFLFPGYTLVAYDDRGTADSGLLQCPALQTEVSSDDEASLAAACAAALGPQRDYYSTADHAEDLEAVRQALGYGQIGLWGVSYGTKLALAYALAHPDHVERLLLDSVLPTQLAEPFGGNVLRALPATLAAYCSGSCRTVAPDFPGDVVALANRLAATPVHGDVPVAGGGTKAVTLDGLDFLGLVVEADVNPGLAAELPAAVRAARLGVVRPLLRLAELDNEVSAQETPQDLSAALFAATVCHDGPFPWQPDTPVADRPGLYQAAVGALPAGALGPFGAWAARFGSADLCLDWPSGAGNATLGTGPLPNVPVLAVSGGLDLRTPTAGAASVVATFPQGHLLLVPGVGHSVVTSDPSGCAARSVHDWMLGRAVAAQCAPAKAYVAPVAAFQSVPAAKRHDAVFTFAVASKTLREAEAAWLMTVGVSGPPASVAGAYGGTLVAKSSSAFTLTRYSVAPGVTVTGRVEVARLGPPISFTGSRLTVGGAAAAQGVLKLVGTSLSGRLGGRLVGR